MSVIEYVVAFTKKMKLVLYLVPIKYSKIKKFTSGLPANVGKMVKLATTLKATILTDRNAKTQIREKGLEKVEAGEKGKLEGSSMYETKKFQSLTLTTINVKRSMLGNTKQK